MQIFDLGKEGEVILDPKDTTDWFVCNDSGVLTVTPPPLNLHASLRTEIDGRFIMGQGVIRIQASIVVLLTSFLRVNFRKIRPFNEMVIRSSYFVDWGEFGELLEKASICVFD